MPYRPNPQPWRTSAWICLWCTALLATSASAQDVPYLREGMTAVAARQQLRQRHWVPDPSKQTRSAPMWGLQKRLYQTGFKEVDQCAVDRPVCILKYRLRHTCLEVEIKGEQAQHMRVVGWTQQCGLGR